MNPEWTSLDRFARATGRSYEAAKKKIQRLDAIERRYDVTPAGRVLMLSTKSLVSLGLITEKQTELLSAESIEYSANQKFSSSQPHGNEQQPEEIQRPGESGTADPAADFEPEILRRLALLPEKERAIIGRRYEVLKEMARGRASAERMEQSAADLGISRAYLLGKLLPLYVNDPIVALFRRERSDAAMPRNFDSALLNVAALDISSSRKTMKQSYDDLSKGARADGKKWGSYGAFCRQVKPLIDSQMKRFAELGERKWRGVFEHTTRMDWSVFKPQELLANDHAELDLDFIDYDGKIRRLWGAFWESLGDRVSSYPTLVEQPNSWSIADALRTNIMMFGKPSMALLDNGKPMKAKLLTGGKSDKELNFDLDESHKDALKVFGIEWMWKGMFENLDMKVTRSERFIPRSKPIERSFGRGRLADWFRAMPGYTGNNWVNKPGTHDDEVKRRRGLLHRDEVETFLHEKIDEYNRTAHRGIEKETQRDAGIPPALDVDYFRQDRIVSELKGFYPESLADVRTLLTTDDFAKSEWKVEVFSPFWRRRVWQLCGWNAVEMPASTLSMLAMNYDERVVTTGGISIWSNLYWAAEMRKLIGEKVFIRWSGADVRKYLNDAGKTKYMLEAVYVFDRSGKFICAAEPVLEMVRAQYSYTRMQEHLEENSHYRREMKEQIKLARRAVNGDADAKVFRIDSLKDEAAKSLEHAEVERKEKKEMKKVAKRKRVENGEDVATTPQETIDAMNKIKPEDIW